VKTTLLPLAILIILSNWTGDLCAVEAPTQPSSVFTKEINLTELSDVLNYPARVIPKINTTILAESDGVISRIFISLGQKVKAGEKLVTLTHTDPIYHYAPLNITSSIHGVVSLIDVTEGSQVIKGQKIASVIDPSQIRITIEVPGQDLSSLSPGMKGEFKLSRNHPFIPVKIVGLSPYVDAMSGTATVELDSPQNRLLHPGVMGQVVFKTHTHVGIQVPDHAIFYRGNDTFVKIVKEGKAKHVPIRIGKKQRGFVEILEGLEPGSILIERSSRFIADGEAVTINTDSQSTLGS
jgi:multidrug efflux pump subunit AcrA (membrane-fusion protein)